MLLKRAAVVPVSRMASVIFVAHEDELDSREVSIEALVLTFEGFWRGSYRATMPADCCSRQPGAAAA